MNNLQIFDHSSFGQIRIVKMDGEPWTVAKDVAESLGIRWNGKTTIQAVPDEWKGVLSVNTPSGTQDMLCLSEQGLYFFLARSDKPAALPFQKWLAGEVLPMIRRTGGYLMAREDDTPEAILARAVLVANGTIERMKARLERARPKELFADAVAGSSTNILIGVMAKLLCQNGVNVGQNRLFQWLRANGYLISRPGESWNMPTQWAVEKGFFEVKERVVCNPDGSNRTTRTPMVTGAGQVHLVNVLMKEGVAG